MNHYTELLNYIRQLAEQLDAVKTVTQGRLDGFDLSKQNIYQILHISIDGGSFTNGSTVVFSVALTCLQKRDTNPEVVEDKFYGNDNEVDNMNETLATLNYIWTKMYKNFEDLNITSTENPTLDAIIFEKQNVLDGWQLTFDVELPNTTLSLCP